MPSKPFANFGTIQETLLAEMELASVPGLIVATVEGDQISTYPLGITNAEIRTSVTDDTVFPAASLSKPVFAYGVLGLVQKGLLDLDQPLGQYLRLPEATEVPQLNEITTRQVLSHSSGLQNWRFSLEDKFEFAFSPGSGFRYSGEGYFYLQRVVEQITGQGIVGFTQDEVLQPLGMEQSSFLWQPAYEQTLTMGHQDRGTPVEEFGARFGKKLWTVAETEEKALRDWQYDDYVRSLPQLHPNLKPLGNDMIPNAAASLLTTAVEYAQFVQTIMISPPKGMLTPQIAVSGPLAWGLGWGLDKGPNEITFWQWGDNGAFKNFIYADPNEQKGILIFTNGERGMVLCERIIRRLTGYEHPAFLWL